MKQTSRLLFTTLIVLLTLLANLVTPVTVYAEEGTPPPATEEPVAVEEELTVAEVFEQLPEDTQIVVINEEGSLEPLAAEEAVTIIAEGDPMWCPAANTTVTADCVNALTVSALLPLLASKDEAGIIYFYTPVPYNTDDVYFDGTDLNIDQLKDNSLTLQGGWNGTTTLNSTITFSGNSVFSVPISVNNWTANVTLNDITVDGATTGNGITIITTGDINLENIKSKNTTAGNGAWLDNSSGTGKITLTGTNEFNLNNEYGLVAYSKGDITLNNISANGNKIYSGAFLYNADGSGNITLTGTNAFNLNKEFGLVAYSKGDITLNDITANGNLNYDGAYLNNTFGTGKIITLSGTNEFNLNNRYGLQAASKGDITLNNVTANENKTYDGAFLYNAGGTGKITLTGTNTFNLNKLYGLEALSKGDITINNITANENKTFGGASLYNAGSPGNITLSGTNVFNLNSTYGLTGYAGGTITLNNITAAANNFGGLNFSHDSSPSSITITCGNVYDNGGYGLSAQLNGPLTLNGVTFSNNTSGNFLLNPAAILTENSYNCNPAGNNNNDPFVGLPLQISSGSADLDCELFSGTALILPNADQVTFKCPITGSGTVSSIGKDGLPGDLPDGMGFISALNAGQNPTGSDKALNGAVIISFAIPDDRKGKDLAILYWDGSQWLDLDLASFTDGRNVINGGYFTADGFFEAVTNFSGTFVLVSK